MQMAGHILFVTEDACSLRDRKASSALQRCGKSNCRHVLLLATGARTIRGPDSEAELLRALSAQLQNACWPGSRRTLKLCDRASPRHGLARLRSRGHNDIIPVGGRVIREDLEWEDDMLLVTLDRSVAVAILALCPISVGHTQSPADFYKGKNIDLYIGYSAGGGYDVYPRSLSPHIGRFLPSNPPIAPHHIPN